MTRNFEEYMNIAVTQAKLSFKEGNKGFGAVIIKDNEVIAAAHDREESEADPTSHAELNAIRLAAQKFGRNLTGFTLVTTHEPCPMCATAIVWSGIKTLVYGYSISDALTEGRTRIDLKCQELFERAGQTIQVHTGVLSYECSLLYRTEVRTEIKKLWGAVPEELLKIGEELKAKRLDWFQQNQAGFSGNETDLLTAGYLLLINKLGIKPEAAPVIMKTENRIVFHSQNFCPTLEACKILDLDTRKICKIINERATAALLKEFSPKLDFKRNYRRIRPYCDYCEEMVVLTEK